MIEPNLVVVRKRQELADDDDPQTNGQYTWHIEKVSARTAREQFSVRGHGVRVAHLDTGYTAHPELVIGTSVRADLGYNFYENKQNPIEPLKTLDEGHGTATASVLVGLEGKQHTGNDPAFVEGVAPAAELVPIRVDENVWWTDLNPAEDVPGICHALKMECQVISMSRSGTDYDSLRDAISLAISHGTIVVAAAGNCTPTCGIWSPANYHDVICATGSTFDMTPWKDSSRGRDVTIAAPAWSVYRARTVKISQTYAFDVGRSSGTSYATPIVAGAAALWIERHGGTAAVAEKLKGRERIAPAFKYLLGKSAKPGKDWDTTQYGPGILDCVALLSSNLPKPEDIPAIESDLRIQSRSSRRTLLEQFLSNQIGVSLDPRARHLFVLEIEAWLRSNGAGDGLDVTTNIAKRLAKDPSISTALRRILES
jgi:subtilisin family serine protease